MHKHFFSWVVLAALFVAVFLSLSVAKAQNQSPWISTPLFLQKQADTSSLPSSLYGNIDCIMEDTINCSVPTAYGAASQNSTVRLSGGSAFLPVTSYIDNRQHFLPVLNSGTAITYSAEPVYGFYLYFNYNFSSAITKIPASLGFSGDQLHINRPPDGQLADKTNHRLAADYTSMGFSPNGQWLVVSDPNVATVRVNLQTFEAVPFAPGFDYSLGLDPAVKTAISNDGRYAVVASQNFNRFVIYDLGTCPAVPDTISGPVACQSRDLKSFMSQQFPDFSFVDAVRFLDDGSLSFYANYQDGAVSKTARFIMSTGSISSQIDYLALGDSYIVGEGAFGYQAGTDTKDNKCHLSLLAYPYLIGHDLNYNSYHSVACSGAVTADITDTSIPNGNKKPQAAGKNDSSYDDQIYSGFLPGYRAQINFVSRYQPKVINLSAGGNDMGFSEIVKSCAISPSTCYSTYEDRLELVRHINNQVFPRLVQTYQTIKAASPPDLRLYVISYPQIAKPGGDCGLNVHLNADEVNFSGQLVAYLDSIVAIAAAKAGVYYIDIQDALNGHRLCEASPGSVAINGLTVGNDRPGRLNGPIGDESYHPNDFGYQLMENKILAASRSLTNPMPPVNPSVVLPPEAELEILNVPHGGRPVNVAEYDPTIADDLGYSQSPLNVHISGPDHGLGPASSLRAELHSDFFQLGSFTADSAGNLSTQILIPGQMPAGFHTLHVYSTDIAGQPIDIYKTIYVAHSAEDLNGDDIADASQPCSGIVVASGIDFDQDSIDDSCDGSIGLPALPTGQAGGRQGLPPTATIQDATPTTSPNSNTVLANSAGSTISPSQNKSSAPGQVLADSIEAQSTTHFNFGWLLVLIPPSLSIFYLFKTRQ